MSVSEQIPVKEVDPDLPAEIAELDLYQRREKIYTRKIEGFFQRLRAYTGWPLMLGFFLLPWINLDGRQSVLFDLPARKFHILNTTFWPQDFVLLAWILIIAAFALFFVTVLFGRVWCGYTCPQTVWTSIFMWMEQKAEGSRNQRIKLDKEPWSLVKLYKRSLKHGMWLGFSLLTAWTFVGYFTPIRDIAGDFLHFSVSPWALFWIGFFTVMTYMNAGWLREQVCLHMCPYARFQSVMFDQNTLIVSYDSARGEKRGSRKKGSDYRAQGLGDCIDCQLCVQVCPTGIDIRDGLQYQCIGCALCIDACNSMMDKMAYPRDLVSYTTENHLQGTPERFLRPRVIGYGVAMIVMLSLFTYKLVARVPLEIDVIRDRGQLYVENSDGTIENSYTVKVMNMDVVDHPYTLSVEGLEGVRISGDTEYRIPSGEIAEIPLRLSIDRQTLSRATHAISFHIRAGDDADLAAEAESRFIAPRTRPAP